MVMVWSRGWTATTEVSSILASDDRRGRRPGEDLVGAGVAVDRLDRGAAFAAELALVDGGEHAPAGVEQPQPAQGEHALVAGHPWMRKVTAAIVSRRSVARRRPRGR